MKDYKFSELSTETSYNKNSYISGVIKSLKAKIDAPVKRIASKDVHIAYSPILENEILVQTDWIEKGIKEVLSY